MRVFCKVIGQKYYINSKGEDCYSLFITTSEFDNEDGFSDFDFYLVRCDEDTFNNVSFLTPGTVDLSVFVKDSRACKICSNFEVLHDN